MRDFIEGLELGTERYDPAVLMPSFFSEMDKGLAEEKSSLAMLHDYLSVSEEVEKTRKLIVVDAGTDYFCVHIDAAPVVGAAIAARSL